MTSCKGSRDLVVIVAFMGLEIELGTDQELGQ